MAKMFYDFTSKQQVNPLDKVSYFIIDPHQPENYKNLKIEQKISDLSETTVIFWKGMPTLVLPVELLELGLTQVHFNEDGSGKIIKQGNCYRSKTILYFQPTENDTIIRITTVL